MWTSPFPTYNQVLQGGILRESGAREGERSTIQGGEVPIRHVFDRHAGPRLHEIVFAGGVVQRIQLDRVRRGIDRRDEQKHSGPARYSDCVAWHNAAFRMAQRFRLPTGGH